MIDYYNLADNKYRTQTYTGTIVISGDSNVFIASATTFWVKPRGVKMVSITAIGGGGGGGAGNSSAATAASGGAGGGSGAITRLTIPAIYLTDSLLLTIGYGGSGGIASSGSTGGNTYVDCIGSNVSTNTGQTRVIQANGGRGGNIGLSGLASTGGAAGTAVALTSGVYQSLGVWVSNAGQIGGAGASGAVGASISINNSGLPITGGAAGGGKTAGNANFAGGNITGFQIIPTITGGANTGVAGDSGIFNNISFFSLGGAGGGALATGTGGKGGDGAIGSGGGGGGAGTTGGNGGNGGPGMIIIVCW